MQPKIGGVVFKVSLSLAFQYYTLQYLSGHILLDNISSLSLSLYLLSLFNLYSCCFCVFVM